MNNVPQSSAIQNNAVFHVESRTGLLPLEYLHRLHSSGILIIQDQPEHHYINPERDSMHSPSVAREVIL